MLGTDFLSFELLRVLSSYCLASNLNFQTPYITSLQIPYILF